MIITGEKYRIVEVEKEGFKTTISLERTTSYLFGLYRVRECGSFFKSDQPYLPGWYDVQTGERVDSDLDTVLHNFNNEYKAKRLLRIAAE